jgi:colanic acid/amylovoran biosynthesis glycosyltransferase
MDENRPKKPVVLVYAEPLLAPSMTFVRSQGESLKSFLPYYISPRFVDDGLPLPEDRIMTIHRQRSKLSRIIELPFKAFGVAPLFVRRLRRLNPVLLHAHFGPMGLRALPLARALDVPLLVTFHGYDATIPDELALQSTYFAHRNYVKHRKKLEQGVVSLLAVSHFVRDHLIRQGFTPDKISIHYIGVDTRLFSPDPAITREPIVLFVGRLEEVKGCDYLIRAMARVQPAFPAAQLVIIGDGPKKDELERMAKESRIKAKFLGFKPQEDVRYWMNRACIFAAPSVRTSSGSEEGCGLVLLEAQAMGLPVVSFSSGGIPEIVSHGETGFLSAERDHEGLSENIITLLTNETLRKRIGQGARARVKRLFDLQTQTQALEAIYQDSLSVPSK